MSQEWYYLEDNEAQTPMSRAISCGYKALSDFMLRQEEQESEQARGETPLHKAAYWGLEDVITSLLAEGENPVERDCEGETPLHKAVRCGHWGVVRTLVSHGADVNVPDDQGMTSLHWAAINGRVDMAEYLLDHGANVNARSLYAGDLTPLGMASLMGYEELSDILEEHGAVA